MDADFYDWFEESGRKDKLRAWLAALKPYLDDASLPLIMIPITSVTAGSVAKDAIERAKVAEAAIHRAKKRR